MRKRSISIPMRVTEKELTTIETKATKAGMNRTDYLIACAVGKRITVIDDLTPLLAELRRIGNNLNQLTRLAHLGKIEAISLAETNEVLQQTYEELRQLARKGAKDLQRYGLDKLAILSVQSHSVALLAGSAGLISTMGTGNDGKTPEEREAEERAREASGNFAAAIALTAVGISLALKKAHTEEENLENEHETEPDNEQEMKL